MQDVLERCVCREEAVQRYRNRISGPLLDRIDLHVEVSALGVDELIAERLEESSANIRERVGAARAIQRERFRNSPGIHCNAHMSSGDLRKFCTPPPAAQTLLRNAVESLGLSARAYDRILKVGRTIADLEGAEILSESHLAEAIHYRSFDRRFSLGKS